MTAFETVLIVDESDPNILFWEMLLGDFGFKEILKTRAGEEAIKILKTKPVHFIVSIWELSSMPGTLLVQKARSGKKRKRIPCIIYSKRMTDQDAHLAKEVGIENILPMPLDKEVARNLVKTIIDTETHLPDTEAKLRKMEDFLADGRPAEALKLVGPSVSKNGPHIPRFKTLLGEIFLTIGKMDKIEKVVKEALEVDPKYTPANYLLARFYSMTGRHDESIELLRNVSANSPENIISMLNLGAAYLSADKVEEAKNTLNKAAELDPEHQEIKDGKAMVAIKEGNLALAAELVSQSENGTELARFYNSVAVSLVAKGEFDKGIETYESAVKVLSDKAKIHLLLYNMGLAWRKKGDLTKGFELLSESYLKEPSYEKAYASLVKLSKELTLAKVPLDSGRLKAIKEARQLFMDSQKNAAAPMEKEAS